MDFNMRMMQFRFIHRLRVGYDNLAVQPFTWASRVPTFMTVTVQTPGRDEKKLHHPLRI